jgi:hypothetical protein
MGSSIRRSPTPPAALRDLPGRLMAAMRRPRGAATNRSISPIAPERSIDTRKSRIDTFKCCIKH